MVSIVDLLRPELLIDFTGRLIGVMQAGGRVSIKVERGRALYLVTETATPPKVELTAAQAAAYWEGPLFARVQAELERVVRSGFGEVTISLEIRATFSIYPAPQK